MISHVCIRRPIFASVLSIVITIAGLAAMVNLPTAQYPEITPPQVTVSAVYAGADAETVANSVAAPIETQVNGVDNMIYMSSTSASTGQFSLTVFFEIGTDPDTAQVQVQNRVNLALSFLPDSVQATGVKVEKRSSTFLLIIGVYSPDGRYDERYVANYTDLYVLDALKRIPGANRAAIFGVPDLAMRIWLKPDRMATLGITPSDIQRAVAAQNQQFGAGSIGKSPTAAPVEMTFPVVTRGRFTEPAESGHCTRARPHRAPMRTEMRVRLFALAWVLLLSGCTVGPDYARPGLDLPETFRFEEREARDLANTAWWTQFRDPVLQELIRIAPVENKDLRIATARIEEFAGRFRTTRADLFPQIGYSVSATGQRTSEVGPVPLSGPGQPREPYESLFTVTWELDV